MSEDDPKQSSSLIKDAEAQTDVTNPKENQSTNANSDNQQASSSSGRRIPTNQNGQATRLWLCYCKAIQIRVFHITWFTFWLCFFGWFATANLYSQISVDLGLNDKDKAYAGGCSVASTVIFRVIIGWLCDKIGSRRSYVILLSICVFPVCGMALVQSPAGYIVTSLFIGVVGGSFVITQYHTTKMFAGKTVGTANATSAGWGNFGGGCANFFMPVLEKHFRSAYGLKSDVAWRVCMLVPGCLYAFMACIYWFFTVDKPPLPAGVTNPSDKVELAAVTVDPKELERKTDSEAANEGFVRAVKDYRTWVLFLVYAACFGIELTVLRFAVGYFINEFGLEQELAGFIVLCFSFCNLFARSIGGLVADVVSRFAKKSLQGRVWSLFIVLFAESVFLILYSFGSEVGLGYTIFMLIAFSLFVQAAEGVTFAIVPFVQPNAIGPVAGIVGAGGNMGAMIFAFVIFSRVPDGISYVGAWLILGIFVFIVSFLTLVIRFSDEEIKAADEKMNTWTQIQKNETK